MNLIYEIYYIQRPSTFGSYCEASGGKVASLAGTPSPPAELAHTASVLPRLASIARQNVKTFSETSASMASVVAKAGLIRPISHQGPPKSAM